MTKLEKIVYLPSRITRNTLPELIRKTNFIYALSNTQQPGVYFFINKIEEMDLLGVMMIYKILEYSYKHKCFANPILSKNDQLMQQVKRYGFGELISECFNDSEKAYKNLKTETIDGFLIAPVALINNACMAEKMANTTILKIEQYLEKENILHTQDICIMLGVVLSELFSNFYAHSSDETNSVIVVRGNKDYIQITCADSGLGIIETMRNIDGYKTKTNQHILQKALQKGVTSKPNTNHMGHGLWLIDDIVTQNNGILFVYTQSVKYTNFYRKKKIQDAPFWKGTIIDIVLNLTNPCY